MEVTLKSKELWSELQAKDRAIETKEKVMEIMVAALGDNLFPVCSAKADDPLQMLKLHDERYSSRRVRTLSRIYPPCTRESTTEKSL